MNSADRAHALPALALRHHDPRPHLPETAADISAMGCGLENPAPPPPPPPVAPRLLERGRAAGCPACCGMPGVGGGQRAGIARGSSARSGPGRHLELKPGIVCDGVGRALSAHVGSRASFAPCWCRKRPPQQREPPKVKSPRTQLGLFSLIVALFDKFFSYLIKSAINLIGIPKQNLKDLWTTDFAELCHPYRCRVFNLIFGMPVL